MLTRLAPTARRRLAGDDSGFTLVEVVVAFLVLAIFASALMVALLNGLKVSKQARQRVAAANLAAREIEIVRNRFATSGAEALVVASQTSVTNQNSLSGTAGAPSVVDGVPYTVVRTAQWQPTGTGETACDGGSAVNFPALKLSVSVTWPNMGFAKPVHAETVTTPLKGQLDDDALAFVAVKVQNAAGLVQPGVPVAASGPGGSFSQTTDASGCATFQVNVAGNYTISLNTAGWVDQTGVQASTKTPVTVAAGGLAQAMMTYDRAAAMDVTVVNPAGYALPSPLPMVNYTQPNVPAAGARRTFASAGATTRISGLWPQTAGYSAWAGGCADSDPAGAPTSGSRVAPVVVAPAGVGAITVPLAAVDITARSSASTTIPNGVVTATSAAAGPCSTPDRTLTLGTTNAAGLLKTSLPYGAWKLSITYSSTTKVATNTTNLQPLATGATAYTLRTY